MPAVTGDDHLTAGRRPTRTIPTPRTRSSTPFADANPFAGAVPLNTEFKAKPFNPNGDVKYYWRFDDGTTSREQNPVHTFAEAGYYTVLMDARDSAGRRDRFTLILGGWPKELWGTTEKRRLTKTEQLDAVRETRAAVPTQRRARLKREGKPVNDLDASPSPAPATGTTGTGTSN